MKCAKIVERSKEITHKYRGIAQLVEQWSPKPRAEGSSPSAPAIAFFKAGEKCRFGPVAQLVRAPPCHGGGRGFESHPGRHKICCCSSAGRALPW